VTISRNLTH